MKFTKSFFCRWHNCAKHRQVSFATIKLDKRYAPPPPAIPSAPPQSATSQHTPAHSTVCGFSADFCARWEILVSKFNCAKRLSDITLCVVVKYLWFSRRKVLHHPTLICIPTNTRIRTKWTTHLEQSIWCMQLERLKQNYMGVDFNLSLVLNWCSLPISSNIDPVVLSKTQNRNFMIL